jgi:hypothetical protein
MADMFELNINKYDMSELRELLNLQDPYTIEDIINSEICLQEKLLSDRAVSPSKKKEILLFLTQVKKRLIGKAKKEMRDVLEARVDTVGPHQTLMPPVASSTLTPLDATDGPKLGTRRTMKEMVCINSIFRDNYYTTFSTDFQLTLPTVIKNVVSMELVSMELPNSYYQISKDLGNNYFWLFWFAGVITDTVNDVETRNGAWFYISVPDGNYSDWEQMVNAINTSIEIATQSYAEAANKVSSSYILPPLFFLDQRTTKTGFAIRSNDPSGNPCQQVIKLAFNRKRGNFVSTVNNHPVKINCIPDIDVESMGGIMTKLGWTLGFRLAEYTNMGTYENLTVTTDKDDEPLPLAGCYQIIGSYISESIYDGWGTKYLYLVVDDYNKNSHNFVVPTYNSSLGKTNVLAKLSLSPELAKAAGYLLGQAEMIADKNMFTKRNYFGPVDIQKLHIQILDEFGRILNLNTMDFGLALNLTCLYDY